MDFGRLGRAGQLQSGLAPPLPSCHNSVKICRPHVNIMNIMQYACMLCMNLCGISIEL